MSCTALGQCFIERIAGRGLLAPSILYINILTKQSKQWAQIPYEKHRLSRGCAGLKDSWLLWFLSLLFILILLPAFLPFSFFFPLLSLNRSIFFYNVKLWEAARTRLAKQHTVNPRDFLCDTFGLPSWDSTKGGPQLCGFCSSFFFSPVSYSTGSNSDSKVLHQYLPLSISPSLLHSISLLPSHFLIFTTQWFKYISCYFSFCFAVFSLTHAFSNPPLSSTYLPLFLPRFHFRSFCLWDDFTGTPPV